MITCVIRFSIYTWQDDICVHVGIVSFPRSIPNLNEISLTSIFQRCRVNGHSSSRNSSWMLDGVGSSSIWKKVDYYIFEFASGINFQGDYHRYYKYLFLLYCNLNIIRFKHGNWHGSNSLYFLHIGPS